MVGTPSSADNSFDQNGCLICCYNASYFVVGECDHPICLQCALRIRALNRSEDCPICRKQLTTCIATKEKQTYANADTLIKRCPTLRQRCGIGFVDNEVFNAAAHVMAFACKVCTNGTQTFDNFYELKQHMRLQHGQYFCQICVANILRFPSEFKCYDSLQLARHRKTGSPDEPNQNGHPICEFCDQRFYDDDTLYRHLRIDHFLCDLCMENSSVRFFATPETLLGHLKMEHFVCDEEECSLEPLGVSFATELELHVHKMRCHGKNADNSRKVRMGNVVSTGARSSRSQPDDDWQSEYEANIRASIRAQHPENQRRPNFNMQAVDFPSLGTSRENVENFVPAQWATADRGRRPYSLDDFPTLVTVAQRTEPAAPTLMNSRQFSAKQASKPPTAGLSSTAEEQFPQLPSASASVGSSASDGVNQWSHVKAPAVKQVKAPVVKEAKAKKKLNVNVGEDFPSLCGTSSTGRNSTPSNSGKVGFSEALKSMPKPPVVVQPKKKHQPPAMGEDDFPQLCPVGVAQQLPTQRAKGKKGKGAVKELKEGGQKKEGGKRRKKKRDLDQGDHSSNESEAETQGKNKGDCDWLTKKYTKAFMRKHMKNNCFHLFALLKYPHVFAAESVRDLRIQSIMPYRRPKDFELRQFFFYCFLRDNLSLDDLDKFEALCCLYDKMKLDDTQFFVEIVNLLDESLFGDIFKRYLILLPDVHRQRRLLKLYLDHCLCSLTGPEGQQFVFDWVKGITLCFVCSQVIGDCDAGEHYSFHFVSQ